MAMNFSVHVALGKSPKIRQMVFAHVLYVVCSIVTFCLSVKKKKSSFENHQPMD